MKNIECTYEMIFHFNCPECKNWWSYATDFNVSICQHAALEIHSALRGSLLNTLGNRERHQGHVSSVNNNRVCCMHCGYEADVRLKEGFLDIENTVLQENGEL